MNDKFIYFNGLKFTRDENTGYYLCSTQNEDGIRSRLHVYIWEFYKGKVPRGYHVHHVDENKSNNELSNLILLSKQEHLTLHGKENAERHYDKMVKNLNDNARPKANEWHGSNVGIDWHKKHYENMKERLHIIREFVCEYCGKNFQSTNIRSRFCTNNCRAAQRRKDGVDNIVKICVKCGGEYTANKYAKTKHCSVCKNQRYKKSKKKS